MIEKDATLISRASSMLRLRLFTCSKYSSEVTSQDRFVILPIPYTMEHICLALTPPGTTLTDRQSYGSPMERLGITSYVDTAC